MSEAKLGLHTLIQLSTVHKMIKQGKTGGAKEFAAKLGLPITTFVHRLDALRSLGAEIEYNRIQHSYEYVNGFEFVFEVKYK